MKIALINHNDLGGGAATACWRLLKAYQSVGLKPSLLVAEKKSSEMFVHSVNKYAWQHKLSLALEKLYFTPYQKSKEFRFQFSVPYFGKDISKNELIKQADVLHIHWTHKSFLSLKNLKQLANLNKPIIWTLHDMWAFTGGCHYTNGCNNFTKNCGNCQYLKNPSDNDLSAKIWQQKQALYHQMNIQFITCSKWLDNIAKSSGLLKNQRVNNIPNPIDIELFVPKNKLQIRKELKLPTNKKLILFVAMNANDERKGFKYFAEGLNHLAKNKPQFINEAEVLVMGKASQETIKQLPLKVHELGFLNESEQIVNAYNAADVFVLPSLQDNLPNVIMEALACGTPCVGFNTGGIPEMIDDKQNGYIAEYKNSRDLATGIKWVLENENRYLTLAENARNKVLNNYSEAIVAEQYLSIYKNLLTN